MCRQIFNAYGAVRCIVCCKKESKKHTHTKISIRIRYCYACRACAVCVCVCALSGDHIRLFGSIFSIVLFFLFISFPVSFRIFMEKCPLSIGMINFHLDKFKHTHTHVCILTYPKFVVTYVLCKMHSNEMSLYVVLKHLFGVCSC